MKKLRFIAVLLLIVSLVLTPFASVSAVSAEEVVRVGEVEALRETNSETYLMSDGTYECVVYAENKYYPDENEVLQPINNAIVAASDGANLLSTQYTNTANAFDVTFSGSGTPEVSISYNGAEISFSPVNATGQGNAHITASECVASIGAVQNCSTLSSLTATGSNTATYANAFGSADLVYVLENEALKEYIILEDSTAPNSFNFLFTLDGVTLQETDGGATFLNAAGEAVFNLGSLYAVDANGVPTDDLAYDFQAVKNNIIGVTVTLDAEYLTAEDRAFPVVIDPTIMISSSSTPDACVCSYTPSTNYQTAAQLRTGFCTDYGIRRSYIKFDIPSSIPSGSVTSARMDIEKLSGVAPTVKAYRVTSSWSSGSITWNNKPGYSTSYASSTSSVLSSGSSWYIMDVTSTVQHWVNGTYTNYGFVLIDNVENDADHWTTIYSSDAVSPHKPELYITYSGEDVTDPDPTPGTGATYHYIHYYDRSFPTTYVSKIQTVSNVASAAYSRQFGIAFSSSSPSVLNTLAGACPLGDEVRCTSACGLPHHKHVKANAEVLHGMAGSGSNKVVCWADRPTSAYCQHIYYEAEEEDYCSVYSSADIYAAVYQAYPNAIQFLNFPVDEGNASAYEAFMGITLIHETVHTLGLSDRYYDDNAETYHDSTGYQCVMESYQGVSSLISFYGKIKNGEYPLCSYCAGLLEALIG